jgi:hypothetical protein
MREIHNPKGKTVVLGLDVGSLSAVHEQDVPQHNAKWRKHLHQQMKKETAHENNIWRGGVRSLEQASAVLDEGWQAGADKALTLAHELEPHMPEPVSRRRLPQWGEQGDELCGDRLLTGQYERMWSQRQRQVTSGMGTVIDIAASWGGNGSLSADQLFWTGAAMVVLCDILENAGYSCGLNLIDAVRWIEDWRTMKARYQVTVVRVKEAGEPLRADAVAAVSAHPGIYRTLALAASDLCPWDVGQGRGQACELDDVLPALIADGEIEPAKIVIPKLQSREAALDFLKRALQDIDAAQYAALEADYD